MLAIEIMQSLGRNSMDEWIIRIYNFGCWSKVGEKEKNSPPKSAPVQNALPTPVMIPTHKLSSSSNSSHILAICLLVGKSTQFNFSGRLSVTCTIRGCGKEI